jgi:amidase
MPRHAALCLRPGGLAIAPDVEAALLDAAQRLRDAGWEVEELDDTPPLREAAELQVLLWVADGFPALAAAVQTEQDPGALAFVAAFRERAAKTKPDDVLRALTTRATYTRAWQLFLQRHPVLLLPVSAEPPFPDGLDLTSFHRVWEAQLTQVALPFMGLPCLTVSTGPLGVQIVAGRYREDLCLKAGEAIEQQQTPIDPK